MHKFWDTGLHEKVEHSKKIIGSEEDCQRPRKIGRGQKRPPPGLLHSKKLWELRERGMRGGEKTFKKRHIGGDGGVGGISVNRKGGQGGRWIGPVSGKKGKIL